jgi:predicted transcriptional regulator
VNLKSAHEEMEIRVKKNSREEITKLQLKYEQQLDQLKEKIQDLKNKNMDNLEDKE